MAIVEKGNVVLEIKESEVDRYLDLGYNVTDGRGHTLKECVPTDIGVLQKAFLDQRSIIDKLKTENARLKAENANLKVDKSIDDTESDKPKTTKKSNKRSK